MYCVVCQRSDLFLKTANNKKLCNNTDHLQNESGYNNTLELQELQKYENQTQNY